MKKIHYWIGIYIIISLMFGLLGAGCEHVLRPKTSVEELLEVCIVSGFLLTTSIMVMFGALFILSYLLKKATEKI